MSVIFIAGVHAVGKTSACDFLKKELGLEYFSASALIKAEKRKAISETGKEVSNVSDNQNLLIRAVGRILPIKKMPILIDGHFTLLTKDARIENIDTDVFNVLTLIHIIVLYDKPAAIYKRFIARDGSSASIELIESHQLSEISHAKKVAVLLGIPILILKAFDYKTLKKEITNIERDALYS